MEIQETLTDAVSEAVAKASDPWLILGGDFNRYDMSIVSQMVPGLIIARSEPTRGDATLDYSFTNFDSLIERTETCFPIESEANKSDHKSVSYEAILTRPSSFAWETSEYLKVTEEGSIKFKNKIDAENWMDIQKLSPNVDEMTELFHKKLDRLISECFVWKRSRKKSCLLYTSPSPRD